MPVGTAVALGLMGASALAKTGAGLASAQGMMSEEEKRRLALLQGMRARGDLGLADRQRAGMESQSVVQRGAALRDMAAAPTPLASSSREVLAQALGQQNAVAMARQQAARDINEADRLAAEAQQAEIQALSAKEAEQKAARRQALLGGVADTAGLASQTLMEDAAKKEKLATEAAALKAKLEADQRVFAALAGNPAAPLPGYKGSLPVSTWFASPSSFWR